MTIVQLKAVKKRGNVKEIGLQLTSGYGIYEDENNIGVFDELFSELLSATQSSVKAKRDNALEVLKEVLQ